MAAPVGGDVELLGDRSDITATDMFAALTGIALASGTPEQREQADGLLDLTPDGLSR
ncbi:hypothetical protein ACIBQ6_19350 [Nonomuraea sp. NPDC049655]|uniref:hypothetical protein n=1 Tax=Nonomuraea sp. NPDC049655 TaxID=3364355 RepID=UPI00378B9367